MELGFDWLFIDAEHTPFQYESIQKLLQTAGKDLPCIVRIPDDRRTSIQKALDIETTGIIVPRVNTAKQASKIIKYAKYCVTNDSGLMHVASAVNPEKVIGIFTLTDPRRLKPLFGKYVQPDLECSPCYMDGKFNKKCKERKCRNLPVQKVLEKIKEVENVYILK